MNHRQLEVYLDDYLLWREARVMIDIENRLGSDMLSHQMLRRCGDLWRTGAYAAIQTAVIEGVELVIYG